jgi:uncharacterized membrane protein YeaQ/YmgE (transglycosylase-associated protein family)
MLLNIILLIVFGAIVGFIASAITGQGARVNGFMNVVIGIVGALLGGFLMNLLGGQGITGFNIYSFLVAIGGAALLLWLTRAFSTR